MTKLRDELYLYSHIEMAFWLGVKVKPLSCYLQNTVEWQKPQSAVFETENNRDVGETEKGGKMKRGKAEAICMSTQATDFLSSCEMRKIRVWLKSKN